MSLFEQLVDQAMRNQNDLLSLRVVVEKELLHHDILRELGGAWCRFADASDVYWRHLFIVTYATKWHN